MSIDPSKRAFFRRAGKKISEVVIDQAEKKAKVQTINWFRPPYAVNELEFLLACIRCGACVIACEPGILFSLTQAQGIKVAGTPAMDLVHHACLLCEDWPCVSACSSGALSRAVYADLAQHEDQPSEDNRSATPLPPKLARITFDESTCLPFFGPECGVCVSVCPVPGALSLRDEKPVVDNDVCVGCAQCRNACVTDPSSIRVMLLNA